jgi:hypothetical protein
MNACSLAPSRTPPASWELPPMLGPGATRPAAAWLG